jgi:hypothetical protein
VGWTIAVVLLAILAIALLLREPIAELRVRRRERERERKRAWRRQRDADRAQRRVERAMNPARAAARRGEPPWQLVAQRHGAKCWLCGTRTVPDDCRRRAAGSVQVGATYPTVDYVVPLADGGTYEMTNLRIAHRQCQQRRAQGGAGAKLGPPRRTFP